MFVREDGSAPGAAFTATLLDLTAATSTTIAVSGSGAATLNLTAGRNYELQPDPAAPLVRDSRSFTYSGASSLPDYTLRDGWLVTLNLTAGGAPVGLVPTARVYSLPRTGPSESFRGTAAPGRFSLALPKSTRNAYTADLGFLQTFALSRYSIGLVTANRTESLDLIPGQNLSLQLARDDGQPFPAGGTIQCNSLPESGVAYIGSALIPAGGNMTMFLPPSLRYSCDIRPSGPVLQQSVTHQILAQDAINRFQLETGHLVTVSFVNENQSAFTGALNFFWSEFERAGGFCRQAPCTFFVPRDRPVAFTGSFSEPGFFEPLVGPQIFPDQAQITATRIRKYIASGRVLEGGAAAAGVRVRAFDAQNQFVISVLTDATGSYRLPLRSGMYTFELDPNREIEDRLSDQSTHLFRSISRSAPVQVQSDTTIPDFALTSAFGLFELQTNEPCTGNAPGSFPRIVAATSTDGRRMERTSSIASSVVSSVAGVCRVTYRPFRVAPGDYSFEITFGGWPSRTLGSVHVDANVTARADLSFAAGDRSLLWSGQARYRNGQAAIGSSVRLYSNALRLLSTSTISSSGDFAVPMNPGWSVAFDLPATEVNTNRVSKRITFESSALPQTVIFDELELTNAAPTGVTRIFGDGATERRYNILFLSEGYTESRESFTDSNGNGVWDGIVWLDLDSNGSFATPTDFFYLYGNAQLPPAGTNPSSVNEPFNDLNGDGIPNIDDRTLFDRNVSVALRSLLGNDLWQHFKPNINVWSMFVPSRQAGNDVVSGTAVVQSRDTAFGSVVFGTGALISDRAAVQSVAYRALPQFDVIVLLVNQPVPIGLENAFPDLVTMIGGAFRTNVNAHDFVHEMGHVLGDLCDEYGYRNTSVGAVDYSDCRNVAYGLGAALVPWRYAIDSNPQIGSPDFDFAGGTRIVEGAANHSGARYRASLDSVMNGTPPFYNVPSMDAMLAQFCAITANPVVVFRGGFENQIRFECP